MERQHIKQMRDQYSEWLSEHQYYYKSAIVKGADLYKPIFQDKSIVPEAKADIDEINLVIQDGIRDCDTLKASYGIAAQKTESLAASANDSIARLLNTAVEEQERLEIFRYLTHKHDKFNSVNDIKASDLKGVYSEYGKYITARLQSSNNTKFDIVSVEGNGYEGNEYVYNSSVFAKTIKDTANRELMLGNNDMDYYEYSRITSSEHLKQDFSLINYDNLPTKCNITLEANTPVNSFKLSTLGQDIILSDLLVSDNGIEFKSVIKDSIKLNNAGFEKDDVVAFPLSKYIRLSLESVQKTNDVIAVSYKDGMKVYDSARRSVIRFNDLKLYRSTYRISGSYVSSPTFKDDISAIAIYSNEVIPGHFEDTKDYFKYALTVNGKSYDVTPINSHKEGLKIIKCIDGNLENSSIETIEDRINTFSLDITINTFSQSDTPFINNIKILTSKSARRRQNIE